MEALLRRLGFAEDDLAGILAEGAAQQELVATRRADLAAMMGRDTDVPEWPFDPGTPWLHVRTFLAALPDVRAYHAEHRIRDDVSWATLADLGRCTAIDRRLHGSGGLRDAQWLTLHFRGLLYELGRLQFERRPGKSSSGELSTRELNLHIPESGPLTPAACDASLEAAAGIFAERAAVCASWLLDPTLADYLAAGSNIVRFQRRFELVDEGPRRRSS
jgi:hypothetical protein